MGLVFTDCFCCLRMTINGFKGAVCKNCTTCLKGLEELPYKSSHSHSSKLVDGGLWCTFSVGPEAVSRFSDSN